MLQKRVKLKIEGFGRRPPVGGTGLSSVLHMGPGPRPLNPALGIGMAGEKGREGGEKGREGRDREFSHFALFSASSVSVLRCCIYPAQVGLYQITSYTTHC